MATTNGDSLEEPVISVESKTPPYMYPSDNDKSLYENHKFKSTGTTTYKYF